MAQQHAFTRKKRTEVDKHVGERLRIARMGAGLTATEVAMRLGYTVQTITNYERGNCRVTCGRLYQLAKIYGKKIAWFFQGVE